MHNNPVVQVHNEAAEIFEGRKQIIISLGTGLGKHLQFDPTLMSIAQSLARISTDTERTANDFFRRDGARAAKAGQYFRFNGPEIGDIGLEESAELPSIERLTQSYLSIPETGLKAESCAKQLAAGEVLLNGLS